MGTSKKLIILLAGLVIISGIFAIRTEVKYKNHEEESAEVVEVLGTYTSEERNKVSESAAQSYKKKQNKDDYSYKGDNYRIHKDKNGNYYETYTVYNTTCKVEREDGTIEEVTIEGKSSPVTVGDSVSILVDENGTIQQDKGQKRGFKAVLMTIPILVGVFAWQKIKRKADSALRSATDKVADAVSDKLKQ